MLLIHQWSSNKYHTSLVLPVWRQAIIWTNAGWFIVNSTIEYKLQLNLNKDTKIFIWKNAFENVISWMGAILFWPECVERINQTRLYFMWGALFSYVSWFKVLLC